MGRASIGCQIQKTKRIGVCFPEPQNDLGDLGEGFLVVAPGIRPLERRDDQRRVVTPEQAFEAGADYLVVGRPVRDAADPRGAALAIQATIAKFFSG